MKTPGKVAPGSRLSQTGSPSRLNSLSPTGFSTKMEENLDSSELDSIEPTNNSEFKLHWKTYPDPADGEKWEMFEEMRAVKRVGWLGEKLPEMDKEQRRYPACLGWFDIEKDKLVFVGDEVFVTQGDVVVYGLSERRGGNKEVVASDEAKTREMEEVVAVVEDSTKERETAKEESKAEEAKDTNPPQPRPQRLSKSKQDFLRIQFHLIVVFSVLASETWLSLADTVKTRSRSCKAKIAHTSEAGTKPKKKAAPKAKKPETAKSPAAAPSASTSEIAQTEVKKKMTGVKSGGKPTVREIYFISKTNLTSNQHSLSPTRQRPFLHRKRLLCK